MRLLKHLKGFSRNSAAPSMGSKHKNLEVPTKIDKSAEDYKTGVLSLKHQFFLSP